MNIICDKNVFYQLVHVIEHHWTFGFLSLSPSSHPVNEYQIHLPKELDLLTSFSADLPCLGIEPGVCISGSFFMG